MNNTPDKTTDSSAESSAGTPAIAAPARKLGDGGSNDENPYPWFKPMPVVWICVIICIVLIVVGSMMNKA